MQGALRASGARTVVSPHPLDFSLSEIGPDKSVLTFVACHRGPSPESVKSRNSGSKETTHLLSPVTIYKQGLSSVGPPCLALSGHRNTNPLFCVFLLPGRGGGEVRMSMFKRLAYLGLVAVVKHLLDGPRSFDRKHPTGSLLATSPRDGRQWLASSAKKTKSPIQPNQLPRIGGLV